MRGRGFALLVVAALLAGCAATPTIPAQLPSLPLPLQLQLSRLDTERPEDRLLVIQAEGNGLHWTLLDPLGVPRARQRLVDGTWRADGLLPPAGEARQLFAALLFALTPPAELAERYPQAVGGDAQRRLPGPDGWRVRYHTRRHFDLDVAPGLTYRVAPLAGAEP